ncbi:Rtf2 RING-finger-domain-containing protein [Entophlyctis helioformis]|nr:Rtf2 RING-finger-domain-containing protein [Entophlyctis helioformis]
MGCDGGTIPKRDELVKTKKAAERPDAASQTLAAWFHCALSKQPLQEPVVSCGLGKLYNKTAVLEFLVDRSSYGDGDVICSHIASLKDVTTLALARNPASFGADAADKRTTAILGSFQNTLTAAQFCCPITQKEMNGKTRFVYLGTCGCVLSEQALKQVSSTACLVCSKPFSPADVVLINPASEDELAAAYGRVEAMRAAEAERKRAKKAEKDALKDAKKAAKAGPADTAASAALIGTSGSDEDATAAAAATTASKKKNKDKKRKHESDGAAATSAKRTNAVAQNINMSLPDLGELAASSRAASDAVKSLYVKRDKDGKSTENQGNFLVRGTFNRFAAGF